MRAFCSTYIRRHGGILGTPTSGVHVARPAVVSVSLTRALAHVTVLQVALVTRARDASEAVLHERALPRAVNTRTVLRRKRCYNKPHSEKNWA
ncbi:hypothetical protein DPMN_105632 [Dreissena polymorpha]|uniref:Uncharacterized protein n=1 Tax=Dreissena polymorpha TaxID=45954 RepID=A0A9D4K3K4_DREPO|nr:hypothetical protein DPMN_105632 [Dreissena polymorpha]